MSEPIYDRVSGDWIGSCLCVEAMQLDPECQWHGRPELRVPTSLISGPKED